MQTQARINLGSGCVGKNKDKIKRRLEDAANLFAFH